MTLHQARCTWTLGVPMTWTPNPGYSGTRRPPAQNNQRAINAHPMSTGDSIQGAFGTGVLFKFRLRTTSCTASRQMGHSVPAAASPGSGIIRPFAAISSAAASEAAAAQAAHQFGCPCFSAENVISAGLAAGLKTFRRVQYAEYAAPCTWSSDSGVGGTVADGASMLSEPHLCREPTWSFSIAPMTAGRRYLFNSRSHFGSPCSAGHGRRQNNASQGRMRI